MNLPIKFLLFLVFISVDAAAMAQPPCPVDQSFLNLENHQTYQVIDLNGAAPINQLACQAYQNWKTILTINPDLPAYAAGAYEGRNEQQIKGQLHLRSSTEDAEIIYHELLHAYLTNQNYQGLASPLSIYYFRDDTLPPMDFPYANYLSGQEFAAYLFQGLLYPQKMDDSLEALLNISKVAKDLSPLNNQLTSTINKTHNKIKLIGVHLSSGDFFVPELEMINQNISADQYGNYLLNKISAFQKLAASVFSIVSEQALKSEFDYIQMEMKPTLTKDKKNKILLNIRNSVFSKDILPGGFLFDYLQWTDTFWKKLGF